jgi:virulence-associated protein VapD
MGKYEKLLFQVLRGTSDANIAFDDLRQLLLRLGFEERRRGSHHTFRKAGIEEKINLHEMITRQRLIRYAKCGR